MRYKITGNIIKFKIHEKNIMKSKKAVFMEIYLPVLTLAMCFLVILMYYHQSKAVENSLVSPYSLIEMQGKAKLFEMQEKMLLKSAVDTNLEWDETSFVQAVQEKFYSELEKDEQKELLDFIFSGLKFNNKIISLNSAERIQFLKKNNIYSFSFESGKLKISRNFEKEITLRAENKRGRNFPVIADFNYSRNYLYDIGGKYFIE
ncbi:hypothetical protein FJZ19_05400 [Candidatus Pacearchaeota archaeon]|nr:hypothetical protein [Candidatus Pacearchaeota archaeon]